MDPRLLRTYNEELAYLRESAREFGIEHDVVAGYLGLKTPSDPDPYVERLLEGVAFLAARVNLKLQDQFPEFTQHLLQAIQPNYLAPTPSMCVAGFEPREREDALVKGLSVPRKTELTARAKGHDTPVRFLTGSEVILYPLVISEAEYLPSRTAVAPWAAAANVRAEAGLRIRFRSTGGVPLRAIAPASLPLYLSGSENVPGELYRQIIGETVSVLAQPVGRAKPAAELPFPEASGFADDQALLPYDGRAFRGYRILSEYFACPERFLFASLNGLGKAFAASPEDSCDIVLLFTRSSSILQGAVSPLNLRLFATPAINLFEMQLGRVPVTPYEHEYLVMPDRTRPLDFEVFRILEAVAHNRTAGASVAAPLYAFGALLYDWQDAIFYVSRFVPRRLSTREQRRRGRTDYTGSSMYVSLTCPGNPGRVADIRELAVRALVTNRELPELLRFGSAGDDFECEATGVKRADVLRPPTRPRAALGLGDAAWRIIGHLTPNYASLVDNAMGDPSLLRDHLALYGRADDPAMRRQIDGILSLASQSVTRRIPGTDRIAFARGRRVRLRLDDSSFDDGRMFLFAAIVDRFLGEFASVNSFVETVFESPDQGEFSRWPPRTGQRPTI